MTEATITLNCRSNKIYKIFAFPVIIKTHVFLTIWFCMIYSFFYSFKTREFKYVLVNYCLNYHHSIEIG